MMCSGVVLCPNGSARIAALIALPFDRTVALAYTPIVIGSVPFTAVSQDFLNGIRAGPVLNRQRCKRHAQAMQVYSYRC